MPKMSVFDLKLHETTTAGALTITCVPGGWIYREFVENGSGGHDMCSVFVPATEELILRHVQRVRFLRDGDFPGIINKEHLRGLYNGLEMALAVLEKRSPIINSRSS